jgi:hypothetical protein
MDVCIADHGWSAAADHDDPKSVAKRSPSFSAQAENRWMPALLIMDGPLLRTMTAVGSGNWHLPPNNPSSSATAEDRWTSAKATMDGPLLRTMTTQRVLPIVPVILRASGESMDICIAEHRWSAAADHDSRGVVWIGQAPAKILSFPRRREPRPLHHRAD